MTPDSSALAAGPPRSGPRVGRVDCFDPERGLGTVVDGEGRELPFHATAIADGSRSIPAGARVAFLEAAGHLGGTEARALTRLDAPGGREAQPAQAGASEPAPSGPGAS